MMKTIALTSLAILTAAGILMAATYVYNCPRCGLVQQYSQPGIYKCPNDGQFMYQK